MEIVDAEIIVTIKFTEQEILWLARYVQNPRGDNESELDNNMREELFNTIATRVELTK